MSCQTASGLTVLHGSIAVATLKQVEPQECALHDRRVLHGNIAVATLKRTETLDQPVARLASVRGYAQRWARVALDAGIIESQGRLKRQVVIVVFEVDPFVE
jgi:hypothetical protein